ncbi:alpha/beta hydrolase family protein [Pseudonocardia sediminis]|uniref:Alpha/beta hydrolase family protein n=1 Tax=Pseudonocardia sediminis TaxID=1397368 RepID=A0A4Q7V6L4_PSEST|nr:alpha/beta hydrolase [Pseudonocardia sediminis]RZT89144.1 alpha/beta hydrolase family protein [Pseudonocardia sediminis]
MSTFERPGVTIHYEEHGTGFPILLIAPGGMRSAIDFWGHAPWNPIEHLSDRYRVIAMDQRNAGESVADIHGTDGWSTYTTDQLALLDHLDVGEFGVLGMCIGGSYIASLLATAPQRVRAAVTLQPIGRHENQERFHEMFDNWAQTQRESHPDVTEKDWAEFRGNMYDGGGILFSVPDEALARFTTPWLVLKGGDEFHPGPVSQQLVDLAPGATLVEQWKEPEHLEAGKKAVDAFLAEHLGD